MTRVLPNDADDIILARLNPWDEPDVLLDSYINVTVASYGALGNGTTDDTAAIQAAIDAVHNAGGGLVVGERNATYLIGRAGDDQLHGGIMLKSGVSLDFNGATLLLSANCDFITNYGLATDDATVATINGNVTVGDTNLPVDTSAGFTIGDLVGVRLGDDSVDANETMCFYFARVTAKPDTTHLTLDVPARVAMTEASTETANKKIYLLNEEGVLEDIYIRNVRLVNPATGAANAETGMWLYFCRNVIIENVYGEHVGAGAVELCYSENCVVRNVHVETCDKQNGQASKGRVVGCFNSRHLLFENIQARDFQGCFCYVEFHCDNIQFRNLTADLTHSGRDGTTDYVFFVNTESSATFEGVTVTGNGAGEVLFDGDVTGGVWHVRDIDVLTTTEVKSLRLADRIGGCVRILHEGTVYVFHTDEARWWQLKIPLTDGMFDYFDMPVAGLILEAEVYLPDEIDADVEGLYIGRSSDTGYHDITSYLETGKLARVDYGACGYGTGFAAGYSLIDEGVRWAVDTYAADTTATYIVVRAKVAEEASAVDTLTWSTSQWESQDNGYAPVEVTGDISDGTVMANLLVALETLGLITDSTTA